MLRTKPVLGIRVVAEQVCVIQLNQVLELIGSLVTDLVDRSDEALAAGSTGEEVCRRVAGEPPRVLLGSVSSRLR